LNILHVGHSVDRVDLNVALALPQAGHHLEVVADPGSRAEQTLSAAGVPVHAFTFRNRLDFAADRRIRDLLAARPFDIVHAYTNRALASVIRAVPRRNRPAIVAYRGTMGHLSWFDPAAWMTYLHPRVDRIVCVSDAVRGYLRGMRIPERKLTVIHKGHDPAWYAGATRESLREFNFPPGAVIAGFVGNVRPVKGGDVLLRAMGRLPADSPLHLLLVGEIRDPVVTRLAAQPEIARRIRLTGFRADATRLSGACDLFAMPSIEREGLPKAAIEAMAQGVPPVVTRVGGMPELVEDGVSGLVIPPRDDAALAEAFLRLAGDPSLRERLGAAARRRIEGPFHISHTIRKTLDLYEALRGSSEPLQ
jgi:glycosyltransferase involved in cell wall biosynthesis